MRFRKLRVTGFKSFVEPAELLIEPGLTGLVGPNGCGKSNLLEAIRWVMGEGSARSLRGGGMDDVIFAGTTRRPARAFAEVSLLLDQEGGEHEVVRRIERGAGSAYRIGGRDARARDVALLFADASTGAHSPALVSQGRVAAVIAAKPTERRQMLEEAAGIAGLHVRRREAEGKLRATDDNLQRLTELLGEADARANTLRRQARAAERYRQLSAEIRVADARHLFARWREAAALAEQARAEASAAEERVRLAAEAQRAAAAHALAAGARRDMARGVAIGVRDAAAIVAQRLDRLGRDKAGVVRRLAELAAQREAIARDRAREDALTRDAAGALARLEEERTALAAALETASAGLPQVEDEAERLEEQARAADQAAGAVQARLAGEEAELRVARAALAGARQRLGRATMEAERIARELAAIGAETPLQAALDQARADQATADAALVAANTRLMGAEEERDTAAEAVDAATSAGAVARAALAAAESEGRALAATLDRGKGDRLLDQLSVDPGYERALAAALGDDLDAPLGDAGPRGWVGAGVQAGDPPLPAGAEPLRPRVSGSEVLARRLAQVGMVEADEGAVLAPGQRLVTRAGSMRRWDGFMAREAGAAAAERLIRANRHADLARQLPTLREASAQARAGETAAQAAGQAARAAIERARGDAATAEQTLRRARREEDSASIQLERRAAQVAGLEERRRRAATELAEAQAGEAQAAHAEATLPEPRASRAELGARQAEAEEARRRLGEARGRRQALARAIERDGHRLQAVRAETEGWAARAADAAERVAGFVARTDAIEADHATLAERPAAIEAMIATARAEVAQADAAVRAAEADDAAAALELRRAEEAAGKAGEALSDLREARAGAAARAEAQETRRAEISQLSGERYQCPAALLAERLGFDPTALAPAAEEAARHERLVADRERIGAVNLVAERELATLEEERTTNAAQRDEIAEAVNRLRGQIGALNREGRQRLRVAFESVDGHFRRLYAQLFAGGEAHLALIDADDPLEAGLEIMAQPPGKRLGSLTLLSGGEQALTAVALVFALFLTSPAPICVLDEVDAPLDDANIERFCDLLDAMTRETDTRYLVVTHNPVTMARMQRLFGVTMVEPGVSRLVSVDLDGAETLLAAAE